MSLSHLSVWMSVFAVFNAVFLTVNLVLLAWRRLQKSQWRDPAWLEGYVKRLEAELAKGRLLQQELAFMASIAERDPNSVIELTATGQLGYCNPAAERTFPDLRTLTHRHPIFQGLQDIMGLVQREGKTEFRRPIRYNERVFEQQLTWTPESGKLGFYMTDVTEWKRLDELKTELLNTVSHELRSPLTSITAGINMITSGMAGPFSEKQGRLLQIAAETTARLNRLLDDLLDLAKMEAGKLDIHRESIDMVLVVTHIGEVFKPIAEERGLTLRLDIRQPAIPLLADADKLHQVLTNLANNAIKFTEKGEVCITLDATPDEVRCRVSDTGKGIPKDRLPSVFGKFQKIGRAVRGEKGTGLGLSLCKTLIELHDGKIWAESVEGQGAFFTFSLPRLRAHAVFDQALERLYERTAAEGKCLSAFILQFEEAPGAEPFADAPALAAKLETIIRKELKSDADFLLRDQSCVFFIINEVDKLQAKALVDRVVQEFIPIAQEVGAHEQLLIRARFTCLPDDGTILEGLQARLVA